MVKTVIIVCLSILPFFTLTADEVKMEGEFVWERGKKDIKGSLKALFTSAGNNKWNVVFNFDWKKKPKVYTGTAIGKITGGKLTGRILNENKKRTFIFTADIKSGKLTGEHWELKKRKGKEKKVRTGTFTMTF